MNTDYCNTCECFDFTDGDSTSSSVSPISTITQSTPSTMSCDSDYAHYISDNYCDDESNNEVCDWDGGDCCGDNVYTDYCDDCECLDPDGTSKAEISCK